MNVGKEKPVKLKFYWLSNRVPYFTGIFFMDTFFPGVPTKQIMGWLEAGKTVNFEFQTMDNEIRLVRFPATGFAEALKRCVKDPAAKPAIPDAKGKEADLW